MQISLICPNLVNNLSLALTTSFRMNDMCKLNKQNQCDKYLNDMVAFLRIHEHLFYLQIMTQLNFTGSLPEFFEDMRKQKHFYNHTEVFLLFK